MLLTDVTKGAGLHVTDGNEILSIVAALHLAGPDKVGIHLLARDFTVHAPSI